MFGHKVEPMLQWIGGRTVEAADSSFFWRDAIVVSEGVERPDEAMSVGEIGCRVIPGAPGIALLEDTRYRTRAFREELHRTRSNSLDARLRRLGIR